MTRDSVTQTRTFLYDSTIQRLVSADNPETGTVIYSYNADGTLASKIDAKNQKVAYAYDGYGRVLEVDRYPVASGPLDPCQTVAYTYDQILLQGYFENIKNVGRLSWVHWGASDGTCPGQYGFDELYGWTAGGLLAQKELLLSATLGGMWYSGELVARYWYDQQGKNVTTFQPPNTGGGYIQYTYAYTYDALGRPLKMTYTPNNQDLVSNVQYGGPGGQMSQMSYGPYTEMLTFDLKSLQLTRQQASGTGVPSVDLEYVYPGTQNNGRITQAKDNISGEVVTYQYDVLNRLSSASASGPTPWSYIYEYDGFGNRTRQGSSYWTYNAQNQHTDSGYQYDANGNLTAMPGGATYSYDVENRLTSANGEQYVCNPSGERICKLAGTLRCQEIRFYGAFGELLGTYQVMTSYPYVTFTTQTTNLYFAGKLVQAQGKWVVLDRLGSVRANSVGETFKYYPYGEERPQETGQNREKFATYYRDGTGLDYAYQRYYSSVTGRFLTPDPVGGGNPGDPQSWNRYPYVHNDPLNSFDPDGLNVRRLDVSFSLTPTCLEGFANQITIGVNEFFNSDVGTMAVHTYFEWRGDNTMADYDANVWRAIANVWRNRWHLTDAQKRFYLGNNAADAVRRKGFRQLFYTDPGQPFWDSKGLLKEYYVSNADFRTPGLVQILNSDPASALCLGFLHAMQVVRDVYNTPWYDHSKDPTKGAFWYGSGGMVPSTPNVTKQISYTASSSTQWLQRTFQFFRADDWNNLWSNTW